MSDQLEYTITIPLSTNEGGDQPAELIAALRVELTAITGGATIKAPEAVGLWPDPDTGALYVDRVQEWAAVAGADIRDQIEAWVKDAGRRLGQRAMWYTARPVAGYLVPIA